MATIKVKNGAGEWVDAASTVSQFKMAWVPASADRRSYDLSAYLDEGDDFLLAFAYGTGTYARTRLYCGSEGKIRIIDGDNMLLNNSGSHSPLEAIADSYETNNKISYDQASRIFSYVVPSGESDQQIFSSYAALIYAG